MNVITGELMARICWAGYEACRGVALACGEVDIATWQIVNDGVKRRYQFAIGVILRNPAIDAQLVHGAWTALMEREGWKFGAEFSESGRLHPQLKRWEELPVSYRMQGEVLIAVVRTFEAKWESTVGVK